MYWIVVAILIGIGLMLAPLALDLVLSLALGLFWLLAAVGVFAIIYHTWWLLEWLLLSILLIVIAFSIIAANFWRRFKEHLRYYRELNWREYIKNEWIKFKEDSSLYWRLHREPKRRMPSDHHLTDGRD